MTAFFDPAPWWLALAGWSVLVALWHTSAVALAFGAWRLWRRSAPAAIQYRAASAALALAAMLTLATPAALLLRGRATPSHATMSPVGVPAPMTVGGPASIPSSVRWRTTARGLGSMAAPWIGAAWCLGFAIGLVRFGGGWALAQWIRGRSMAVHATKVVDAAAAVSTTWDLPPALLLTSAHVEAPVVVGVRAPAVLLPIDLEQRLDLEALSPLLAHELAHVDRRDYAANLLQSLADALLFFSPGARWLSRHVRDAREYCCDDIVAARCGAGAYASALTTLARLGVVATARPAVNAAGPRLIVRIRRILQEDTMTRFAGFRFASIAALLALAAAAGRGVIAISAAGLAQATTVTFTAPITGPVPMSFIHTQAGAAVRLRNMTSSDAASCGTATLENRATVAVTGVRFAAHAVVAGPQASSLSGVSHTASALLPVDVPPGGTADVAVDLLSLNDLRETLRFGFPHVMCALMEIRYANGWAWSAEPATAFAPTHAEVDRALLGGAAVAGAPICRDQAGGEYSDGAVVPIALEPGAFARCQDGAWSEYQLPGVPPDAR